MNNIFQTPVLLIRVIECIKEHNWLFKHLKKVRSSQPAILVLSWIKNTFSLRVSLIMLTPVSNVNIYNALLLKANNGNLLRRHASTFHTAPLKCYILALGVSFCFTKCMKLSLPVLHYFCQKFWDEDLKKSFSCGYFGVFIAKWLFFDVFWGFKSVNLYKPRSVEKI